MCLAVGLLIFIDGPFAATFCRSANQTSQDSDSTDLEREAQPDNPAKETSQDTGPQVDVGTTKSRESKVDGTSITKPPRALSVANPSVPTGKNLPERTQHFAVAIDVGHSKAQGGAVSARGVFEYQFNRRLGGELLNVLKSSGFSHSFMINPGGADIPLAKRAEIANEQHADVFLAIHHDSVKDRFLKDWTVDGKTEKFCDQFHGYSVFFSRKNVAATSSRAFALQLGQALLTAGFTPTLHHIEQEHRPIIDPAKGVYAFDDLIVLKGAKMPAVLLECGVIVNRIEEEKLNTTEYRSRLTSAIETAMGKFANTLPIAAKGD
jgi:N-acetylmuramoyl-L-alanine amidase